MKLNYGIIQKFAFGVSYTEKSDDKIIFSRFSEQERAVLSYGKEKSFTTAGVRLEFDTDSLHLKIATHTEGHIPHGRTFYSFDVYCGNNMIGQIKNFSGEPEYPYSQYTLDDRQKSFTLPAGMKRIRIFFPWSVRGMIKKIEIDDGSVILPAKKSRKIIMYGDYITQGYDAASPSLSYASRLADLLDADCINKGIGGSLFTPELAKIKTDFSARPYNRFVGYKRLEIFGI